VTAQRMNRDGFSTGPDRVSSYRAELVLRQRDPAIRDGASRLVVFCTREWQCDGAYCLPGPRIPKRHPLIRFGGTGGNSGASSLVLMAQHQGA
jgi:hypothetical protein